jgi:HK97 family phage prohead protease
MERKLLALDATEIKFSGSKAGVFEGYASVFGGVDSYGDTIVRGAFQNVLKAGKNPKMFWNHRSWELPVGKWTKMEEDDRGLKVAGEFTPGSPQAEAVKAAVEHGTVDGLSIGFRMSGDDYEITDKGRLIKNVSELVEVSVVTFPADSAARVDMESVKSALEGVETLADFERFLRDAGGFSKSVATALVSKARTIARSESGAEDAAKAAAELRQMFQSFRLNQG